MGRPEVESVEGDRDYAHRYLTTSSTLNLIVDRFCLHFLTDSRIPRGSRHVSIVYIELARIPIYHFI
jgi:hypothetical protein